MSRTVEQIQFAPRMPKPIRVAAYARVSSGKDAMLHSLAAQVDHYSTYIRHHHGWEYVGVYADEAKTGTRDSRENFQRMLTDCRSGKIDHIITKSISRFSRNTVTLLETVRELKELGISVYFEEQSIDTATADGELMLSILASYAQEESLSASENQKWRVKRNFEEGELPQYHATDTHEAIIPLETFNAVQAEIRRRKEKYAPTKPQQPSPFTGLITCAICGKHYRRKTTATGPVWICSTYNSYGKSYCPSKAIPEEKLMQTAALVGHTGEITAITAHNDNLLEFTLKDGTNAVKRWQDRSRAESWTAEMRRAVGEKTRERKQHHAES